ncbi:hypothetical protein PMG71_15230 [Roseofilum sp. BLCC_M154]|uniref:Uncharacterized protein n=1 Tax=Roseofilum acuticapitatum BLCC-M154 TaxID=3022444 RepID=A0ABT7AV57_9CYAN|nr:hypothetical protein [Roseofilum acuticapitatum]MDJ1170784.1 hypothetical protein [Roseofilum acuticapitatum BLCC-M154]
MTQSQRIFICTLVALASSGFGFAAGGNLQFQSQMKTCQDYSWPFKNLCQLWVGPTAWLQGSTTGAWVGMVLGGFVAGLATAKKSPQQQPQSLEPANLEQVLSSLETQMPEVHQLSDRERLILALGMQLSQSEPTEALKLHAVKQLVASLEPSLESRKMEISEEDQDEIGR